MNDQRDELEAAMAAHRAGRLDEAGRGYRAVLAAEAGHVEALNMLGVLEHQLGRDEVAVELLERAVKLAPENAAVWANLGEAERARGRLDAALTCYGRALELRPELAEVGRVAGEVLVELERLDEAEACLREVLRRRPEDADAWHTLGHALLYQGRVQEALACYRRALAVRSDYAAAHSSLILAMHYVPVCSGPDILAEARRWAQRHAAGEAERGHRNDRSPTRRLRIGYVSADFCRHVSAQFLLPLLQRHDRTGFEVYCYAEVAREDELTARLRALAQGWRSTVGRSDAEVAAQVRDDGIDILVDLKLHTRGHRLGVFTLKPAPVQVTWLGYPGTTGLGAIDYRLTDPHLDPPTESARDAWYSEQSVQLPETFWCYDPQASIEVGALPAQQSGRITFGALNNYCKVHDGVLALWARVLRAVPGARLVLRCPAGQARGRALEVFAREGIAPDRIAWFTTTARADYLAAYRAIDIGLDTSPYNGHTTSLDAFWMGVPVVTLVGTTAVGRAGFSHAMNLGLPDLAAQTPEDFVARASALATDLGRLAELRSTLRRRMEASPLMDAPRFVRRLEDAYRTMWRQWCEAPA
jgi:predicted O-linked N-acetylglucosamine transferase (SPINDLY family)